jgi:hypothetical protein
MVKRLSPVKYSLISDRIENSSYPQQIVTYGIIARSAEHFSAIRDISTCRLWVERLVCQLNRLQVSLCHFREVVEDALAF